MDEMNKNTGRPMSEDTLKEILASLEGEKAAGTTAEQPPEHTATGIEVDEKFRDFFTTTVAVIPDSAMTGSIGDAAEEAPGEPRKKGVFGRLGGWFRREEAKKPASARTGELLIPGQTQPEPEPEPQPKPEPEPSDDTMQIDLHMVQHKPQPDRPADATGEIRLDELPELRARKQPAAEKPARPEKKKKEKKAKPAAQPPVAAAPAAAEPQAPAVPAAAPLQADKLKFEDIDIGAILAAGLPELAAVQPPVERPAEPQPEPGPSADAPEVELLPVEEQPEQTDAVPEEATRELPDLAALVRPAAPPVTDEPTGEVVLTLEEADAVDEAATREVMPQIVPMVEHSTHEPQLVAVEEPTGEVLLTPAEEEPTGEVQLAVAKEEPAEPQPAAAPELPQQEAEAPTRPVEVQTKVRTAAVRLFGDEEEPDAPTTVLEDDAPEAETPPRPPLRRPEPAAVEYEDPADAEAVSGNLRSALTRLTVRLVLTGLGAVVLLVLGLAAQGVVSLGAALDPQTAPQAFLGIDLILLLVTAGVSWPILRSGLSGLFGQPSPHTLPALATVAAVVQLLVCLLLGDRYDPAQLTVFAPAAALLLFADTLGARLMQQVVKENFGLVSNGVDHSVAYCLKDKKLAETLAAGMEEKEPNLLLSRPATMVKGFLAQSFSARRSDATAQKLARILLAAAVVGALIPLVQGKGMLNAVTSFAGVLCLGAPLSATLVAAVPSLLMQRAASQVGAVVPGWYNVEQLGRIHLLQVDAKELFTPACAQLEGIKTFRKERIDLAILYATSVLIEGCNTLDGMFLAMIEGKTEMLYEVKDLEKKPGLGIVAWCENSRVVLGNRAMMAQEDIALPPLDYEHRYTQDGEHQALYLAVSGQLYALFVLSYRGERGIARSMATLRKRNIRLLVTAEDPTLTAERIEKAYRLEPGFVKMLSAEEQAALEPATRYMPASEGCMVHLGSFASFVGGLKAAAGADEGERSACSLQFISVLFSVVLGLFLAFTGGITGISLLAALLYQLAWSTLSVAIALTKKY